MIGLEYCVRCQLCGHLIETSDLENLKCDDCGYDKFDIIFDPNSKSKSNDDTVVEPTVDTEPKNCIVYLVTRYGDTMVVMKNSRLQYSPITHIGPNVRRYTYNGALSARDAMMKRHPDWNLKVKQF